MRLENESIKSHVTHEFEQHRNEKGRKRYRQLFLESLHYPEINRRQDTVTEAHQKTFHWVYDTDGFDKSARGWQSIAEWLENGDGIYWINGKAGSGKSTLMNYLSHHERTLGLLRVWSGTKKILSPKYFFWSTGTTLENSVEGLLRSLLYQIFREVPSLIPVSCENRSASVFAEECSDNYGPIGTWTLRTLRTTFQTVIRQIETTYRVCIFIDGLDEINGDPDTAIGEVTSMTSFGVKICLSSRPERSFNDAFDSCAKLRLQDLTEHDIREYAADRLEPWLRAEAEDEVSKMLDDIAEKAQGVFLWVDLVVKALIKGLKNDDNLEQLQMRVSSTPSDIEAVYAKMLGKVEEPHHKEAARLFQMALVGLTHSFLDVALVLYDHCGRNSETSVSEILKFCHRTRNRIPTVCGGLLDIDSEERDTEVGGGSFDARYCLCLPIRYTCSSDTAELSFFERYVHVNFIHRTAAEFLSKNKQGQSFLDVWPQPRPSPYASLVRANLAKVRLLGLPEKPSNLNDSIEGVYQIGREPLLIRNLPIEERWDHVRERIARNFIYGLMDLLRLAECLLGSLSVSLYHDVDQTLTAVYRQNQVEPLVGHWSMQWGWRAWEATYSQGWYPLYEGYSTYLDAQSAMMEPIKSRPVDFLGHAASWSLSSYVVEEYDKQKKTMEKDHATHLLCCSMWAFSSECRADILLRSLDLVAHLLSRGARPNFYVKDFSATIWGYFIRMAPWGYDNVQEKLVMTTKTFVEKGADVHMTLLNVKHFIWNPPEGQVSAAGERPTISLSRRISILRYLQAHSDVVEFLQAKGAQSHSKYTHISVKPQTNGLSRKQYDKWLAALNTGHVECAHGFDYVRKWRRFAGQFRKYYEDNSGENQDSDIEIHWEVDDDQDIDLNSLTMIECMGFQTEADLQQYQPIDILAGESCAVALLPRTPEGGPNTLS